MWIAESESRNGRRTREYKGSGREKSIIIMLIEEGEDDISEGPTAPRDTDADANRRLV